MPIVNFTATSTDHLDKSRMADLFELLAASAKGATKPPVTNAPAQSQRAFYEHLSMTLKLGVPCLSSLTF